MTTSEFDADLLIDANLPLLGLQLTPDSRAIVKMHVETAERLSRLVREFPLDDDVEAAPVYRA